MDRALRGAGADETGVFQFHDHADDYLCLALLMFSMGITLTVDDFLRVFKKPDVIGLGFLYC